MITFNFEQNSATLKINPLIYVRIARAAVQQAQEDRTALDNALANSDWAKVQEISHRWKGDFANLRLSDLSELARQLNEIAKASVQDMNQAGALYGQFKEVLQHLEKALASTG